MHRKSPTPARASPARRRAANALGDGAKARYDRASGRKAAGGGMPRILVVDDEPVVIEVLSSLLEDPERQILTATSSAAALQHANAGELAVALIDKNLGPDSGLDLSRQLKQLQPEVEIILITGYASIESAIEAVQIGAFDYLTKPVSDFSALSFKVQSAIEKSELRRSQRALLERLLECEVRHRRVIDAVPEAMVLYDAAT